MDAGQWHQEGADMWDKRYSQPGFVFGTQPAAFLLKHRDHLPKSGTCLCVADGEGRNSVWLAGQGLTVTANDSSPVGLEKARGLARDANVDVDFRVADLAAWDWAPDTWDVVAAIFIQFADPAFRNQIFAGMKQTLKPGGVLLLHGYRPEQIAYGTGGPRAVENLYTKAMLRDAFGDWQIDVLDAYDAEVDEGAGHSGMSALIDLVATKPG